MSKPLILIIGTLFSVSLSFSNPIDSMYSVMKTEKDMSKLPALLTEYKDLIQASNASDKLGRAYFLIAFRMNKESNISKSFTYYSQALKAFKAVDDMNGQQKVYENIAHLYTSVDNYELGEKYYTEALSVNKDWGNQIQIGLSLRDLGLVALRRGQTLKALQKLNAAFSIFESEGAMNLVGEVFIDLGNVFKYIGSLDKANGYYYNAIQSSENKRTQAKALNNIAEVEFLRGDTKVAVSKLQECLILKNEVNDNKLMVSSLNNLGLFQLDAIDIDSAIISFSKAFKYNIKPSKSGLNHEELHMSYTYLDGIAVRIGDRSFMSEIDAEYRSILMTIHQDFTLLNKKDRKFQAELYQESVAHQKKQDNQAKLILIIFLLLSSTIYGLYIVRKRKKAAQIKCDEELLNDIHNKLDRLQ